MSNNLLTDLEAYWKLDEASGSRSDSSGNGWTLTDNNTVGSTTGLINDQAQFVAANSEWLSNSSAVTSPTSAIVSVSLWFDAASLGNGRIFSLYDGTNSIQIVLDNSSGQLCTKHSQWQTGFDSTQWFAPSTGTRYHIVVVWDSVNNTTALWKDGSSQTGSSGPIVGDGGTATTTTLGRRPDGIVYYDGKIDEVGVWSKALTGTDATNLYNSGSGLAYSNFDSGASSFSATSALTTAPATTSAAATSTPPTFSGTSAATTGAATTSAAATATPPTFSATAGLSAAPATTSAAATAGPPTFTATAAVSTGAATSSSAATATPPTFTASAALSAAAAVLAATVSTNTAAGGITRLRASGGTRLGAVGGVRLGATGGTRLGRARS
jgi:hypothetical protein